MASLARKTLSAFIGAAMIGAPIAAYASDDAAANENIANSTTAVPQKLKIQYVGVQDRTINDARTAAADASHNKVAIIVWGGNRTIQAEAYKAALDLIDMGIPTAFVLAPDHNNLDGDAVMQTYAASTPRSDAHWGLNNADKVREDMREAGIAAYKQAFPQRVATLSIR